jgi:hypothetical protein
LDAARVALAGVALAGFALTRIGLDCATTGFAVGSHCPASSYETCARVGVQGRRSERVWLRAWNRLAAATI